jgi:acetolactate synthase I/II/III large subunit
MRMTGGQAMAGQLVREGVDVVFGVPGVQLDDGVDGLATAAPQIRFVTARHEQATTYMADGYARVAGKPGVAMVVPGPGMLNALSGLATAYACSSPVLALVGQVPSGMIGEGRGVLHEIPNQSAILHGLTKWSGLARSPEEIPGLIREAFAQMASGRPRPVAVEIPPDVLAAEADVALLDPTAPAPPPLDTAGLTEVAAALARARRPVIVVGHGVAAADGYGELRALAERLRAPVGKTWFGADVLDDRHPLAVPPHGLRMLLEDADVVLAVGTRFMDRRGSPLPAAEGATTISINVDAHDLGHPRAFTLALKADARQALAALREALDGELAAEDGAPAAARARAWCAEQLTALGPQMAWLAAIRAGLDDRGILVTDLTQVGYVAELGYPVHQPRTLVGAGYQGTLGFGFPTALGVRVGAPDRAVVVVVGDGGFGYALSELATAKRYGIGVVVALYVDGAYGNVRRMQRQRFNGRVVGSELSNPDFVALARSFGVHATRVTEPEELRGVIRERGGLAEPTLVEIPLGDVPDPWPLIIGGGR